MPIEELLKQRYEKFRKLGNFAEATREAGAQRLTKSRLDQRLTWPERRAFAHPGGSGG